MKKPTCRGWEEESVRDNKQSQPEKYTETYGWGRPLGLSEELLQEMGITESFHPRPAVTYLHTCGRPIPPVLSPQRLPCDHSSPPPGPSFVLPFLPSLLPPPSLPSSSSCNSVFLHASTGFALTLNILAPRSLSHSPDRF